MTDGLQEGETGLFDGATLGVDVGISVGRLEGKRDTLGAALEGIIGVDVGDDDGSPGTPALYTTRDPEQELELTQPSMIKKFTHSILSEENE